MSDSDTGSAPNGIHLLPLPGIPLVQAGDDLAQLIVEAIERAGLRPVSGDVVVIAQKVVSKAENCLVDLATIAPSDRAREIAAQVDKDPRLVEIILSEAKNVVRAQLGVLIVEHRNGFVVANAGVDQSNTGDGDGRDVALKLPIDPDASAEALRMRLERHFGVKLGVVINDSFGRPWRLGTCGVALGAAGLPSLRDMRGAPDLFGRVLQATEIGFADEIAAAASLLMGQAAEGNPAVLVRGLTWSEPSNPAKALIRAKDENLFR